MDGSGQRQMWPPLPVHELPHVGQKWTGTWPPLPSGGGPPPDLLRAPMGQPPLQIGQRRPLTLPVLPQYMQPSARTVMTRASNERIMGPASR